MNQIRTFVLMPRSAQAAELRRLMNTESNSPFRPRQVGPSTNPMEMPAMFDREDFEKMLYIIENVRQITYQDFITDEDAK